MLARALERIKRFFVKFGFFLAALLFLVSFATLPVVIATVIQDSVDPPNERLAHFTPANIQPMANYDRLHVHIASLDEVNMLAKLRIHGFRTCSVECGPYEERVLFFNADSRNDHLEEAIPSYQAVSMPKISKEFTTDILVPMRGNFFFYPFDNYRIAIGVAVERKYPDGKTVVLSREETEGRLIITLEDDVPASNLTAVSIINPKGVKPSKLPYEYAYARQLKFERPSYFSIIVVLVMTLSIVMTIFTMLTKPVDKLVGDSGALIFGMWGIRSLFLANYPAGVTLLDTALQAMVVFVLMSVGLRTMNFLHRKGHMRVLFWARKPVERECPLCLTVIKVQAKRCPACTSFVDPT